MRECSEIRIKCDYSFYGKLMYVVPEFDVKIKSENFADDVSVVMLVKSELAQALKEKLTDLSNGIALEISICRRLYRLMQLNCHQFMRVILCCLALIVWCCSMKISAPHTVIRGWATFQTRLVWQKQWEKEVFP